MNALLLLAPLSLFLETGLPIGLFVPGGDTLLLALGALAPLELKGLEAQYLQAQSAYENAKEALARLEREDDLRLLRLQVEAARLQVQQAEIGRASCRERVCQYV